jgi:predicted metal-dependent hydrolase
LIQRFAGDSLDPHYLGFFDCFNQAAFFEAHEVLEDLWLADRRGPNGAFYKGLIQLAGAFVHVQKARPGPAKALLNLAEGNLRRYPAIHERLDISALLVLIETWRRQLSLPPSGGADSFPKLTLVGPA